MSIMFFYICLLLVTYLYIGYPVLILILSKIFYKNIEKKESYEPFVTIMIPVKNEEFTIEEKIYNIFELDYPKEKLQILIIDSSSDDKTQEIVRHFLKKWVQMKIVPHNGKAFAMKEGIDKYATGEIIVSTDANAYFKKNTLRKIVRNYYDKKVWGVTWAMLQIDKSGTWESIWGDLYWKIERFIRICETKFFSVITMSWELTSFRKKIIRNKEWYYGGDPDDFDLSLFVILKWYRLIYEKEAHVFEKAPDTQADVEKQKVRIIVQTISAFTHYFKALFYGRYGFILFSHKFLPLLSPLIFLWLFITNIFLLNNLFFQIFFVLQTIFYIIFILKINISFLKITNFFIFLNFLIFKSYFVYISWKDFTKWDKIMSSRK